MLDSPETVIVCKACEALKKYVEICEYHNISINTWNYNIFQLSAEPNCIEVVELGSLARLVKLLSSTEKVIRSYAVLCLAAMLTNGKI